MMNDFSQKCLVNPDTDVFKYFSSIYVLQSIRKWFLGHMEFVAAIPQMATGKNQQCRRTYKKSNIQTIFEMESMGKKLVWFVTAVLQMAT